ncbi:uncharacterized protein LOC117172839 [Belonocnema kinseyi]|uniref:uncharacterized protein LOC117172839 n=1 Tax=Belonocnema kinseyi TaxID=2817044 RepID=UPI00143D84C7|nr:uncharacterized protein LOC117172839 [Belonocnema kinseyi]
MHNLPLGAVRSCSFWGGSSVWDMGVKRTSACMRVDMDERTPVNGFFWDPKVANLRGCVLAKGVNVIPLRELCSRDLMVIVTDLKGKGRLVMGSADFPYDSDTNPPEEVSEASNRERTTSVQCLSRDP